MNAEDRAKALDVWTKFGETMFGPDGADVKRMLAGPDRATPERLIVALNRLALTFTAGGVALLMADDEPPHPHAHAASMRLCHEAGLRGFAAHGASPAATHEFLLNAAIEAGCDRALFLGHDSVIDRQGLWQLMGSMDRHGAAAMAAITVVPVVPPNPPRELSAFVGQDGAFARLTKDDVPRSGTAFPVHHVDGIVALLLDLDQIRKYSAPRFASRTEGTDHVSEHQGFAKWLDRHNLTLMVDPKAQVARVAQQLYGWRWEPPKENG